MNGKVFPGGRTLKGRSDLCIKSGGNSRQGAQHKQSWGKGINEYLFIVSSRDSREGLCARREDED